MSYTAVPTDFKQVKSAWFEGFKNCLLLALPINSFNHISVAGCRYDFGFFGSTRLIYDGMKNKYTPGIKNFGHGLSGHFCKDIPRLGLNALNFYIFYPRLIKNFEPMEASLILATGCAAAEVAINPFDTWRVNVQAGEKLTFSLRKLYAGSFLGGVRLFCTWSLYGFFKHQYDPLLKKYEIDPFSLKGIMIESPLLAITYTPFVYPLERIKNHLQYRAQILRAPFGQQTYLAAQEVIKQQGLKGLYRGMGAKFVVNTCFAFAGSMLSAKGIEASEMGLD